MLRSIGRCVGGWAGVCVCVCVCVCVWCLVFIVEWGGKGMCAINTVIYKILLGRSRCVDLNDQHMQCWQRTEIGMYAQALAECWDRKKLCGGVCAVQ
jgi:hypothetical protein